MKTCRTCAHRKGWVNYCGKGKSRLWCDVTACKRARGGFKLITMATKACEKYREVVK
jgi:hypothetical protein